MLTLSPSLSKLKTSYYVTLHLPNLRHGISSFSNSFEPKSLSLLLQGNVPTTHVLQIHGRIVRVGADQDNLIATRLIGHYKPQLALAVFNYLQQPNIFPFNAIIRVVSEEGLLFHALSIFKILKLKSIWPNDFTFSFLLKAFVRSNEVPNVEQIHTHIMKSGFNCDSVVCNSLLTVYAKGVKGLHSAQRLFDEIPEKTLVFCWTRLIAAYTQSGQPKEALCLFLKMTKENIKPEDDTMVSVLSACSSFKIQEIERWAKVFTEYSDHSNDVNNCNSDFVDTILVYLYAKQGNIHTSRNFFDRITERGQYRSVIHWNTMIGGYVQNGCLREALSLFKLMLVGPNPRPNHVTMVSVLSACAQVGDLDLGKWIHEYLKGSGRKGVLETNTYLATALIDMYSKCGSLENSMVVFRQMVFKDVVSFNAMIMGLSLNGQGKEALQLFSRMEGFGIKPNAGTLLGVLSACNHSGMVDEGRRIFLNMVSCYSITPEVEHYACYIDLLARVGNIDEAVEVVSSMPVEPNGLVWGALLQSCLTHNRVDLAEDIAGRLVKLDPANSGGYVILSNLYASDRRWGEILKLRGLMRENRVQKQPGCSWIRINGVVHEFLVGSSSHPEIQNIYSLLKGFSKDMLSLEL